MSIDMAPIDTETFQIDISPSNCITRTKELSPEIFGETTSRTTQIGCVRDSQHITGKHFAIAYHICPFNRIYST